MEKIVFPLNIPNDISGYYKTNIQITNLVGKQIYKYRFTIRGSASDLNVDDILLPISYRFDVHMNSLAASNMTISTADDINFVYYATYKGGYMEINTREQPIKFTSINLPIEFFDLVEANYNLTFYGEFYYL